MTYRKGIVIGENDNLHRYPPWPTLKTVAQYGSNGMMPYKKTEEKPYYMSLYGDDVVVVNTPQ